MGTNITGIDTVSLQSAGNPYTFTANTTQGLVINAGADAATVTVGSASQTVNGSGGSLHVLATAANAGVVVKGGTGSKLLEVITSGTVALNSADNNVTVQLDGTSTLLCEPAGVNDSGDTLVNAGLIDVSSVALTIHYGTFTDTGTISVSGGSSFIVQSTKFTNMSGSELTGGTYVVDTGSTLQLPDNATIATLATNLTLSGAGSVVESYNTTTRLQVPLDEHALDDRRRWDAAGARRTQLHDNEFDYRRRSSRSRCRHLPNPVDECSERGRAHGGCRWHPGAEFAARC